MKNPDIISISKCTRSDRRCCRFLPLAFLLLTMLLPLRTNAVDRYMMQITFAGYTANETLTNFPALLVLANNMNDSSFAYNQLVSTNGYDLRFSPNSNETSYLNYEIEKWNSAGNSYVWVQVPALSSNSSIWAFWGNSTNTFLPAYTTNGSTCQTALCWCNI